MQPLPIRSQPAWPVLKAFRPPSSPGSGPTKLALMVVLLILGVFGFVRYGLPVLSGNQPAGPSLSAQEPAIPASVSEDLLRHLESAISSAAGASAEIQRNHDWAERIVPSLEKNYLGVERRRLEAAQVAAESARRQIERTREDLM